MGTKESFTDSVAEKLKSKYGDGVQSIQVEGRENKDLENFIQTVREAEESTKNSNLNFC